MSPTSPSSSVQQARQALADRLRDIRLDAGLTARQIAHACGWHESKCSRIEHARTAPSQDDIRAWCAACGAEGQAEDLIASLRAMNSMYVEWRRLLRSGLRRQQESRLPLYERTRHFRSYSSWLVPGLLQTRAYAAAVLNTARRSQDLPDDVAEAVASRMQRQRILHEGDHRFAFLIEETVLRNAVADAETLAGQLDHLITSSSLPSVSLGIIPTQTDRARWPAEGFWIFDDAQVNVELVSSYLTITQPREIHDYARVFAELSSMAVYGSAARSVITSAIESLH
ncbi:helix-turn-helix transcriptional regulator [Actinomadura barringtoniae]|uniref:Helix-turn-helix transcriptional regulator n=1 Tax=Actinomadura barringtoniae TaxID=1427535 RepID=A0A939PJ20_9ACTN|nr:helix-turn-helix transcriptional regulator [Actinomadura barringtoniae]MBO2453641.1 helix-turn-helix transcriptional regulator [Actinomadura barringtoniae]